ncbi:MAG: hypothetical protein AAGK03_03625 [Pseudomonadota bacterium]
MSENGDRGPRFSLPPSLIIELIVLVAACVAAWSVLRTNVDALKEDGTARDDEIAAIEEDISDLQKMSARHDERFSLILANLSELRRLLEPTRHPN